MFGHLRSAHKGLAMQPRCTALLTHGQGVTPLHTRQSRLCCAADHAQRGAPSDDDRRYIMQALELAKRAVGKTYPNPAVGCVIVKDGRVVGEGFHPKAGMPHAEVYALRGAGQLARGATAYVTLEPCNHFGRTPPCSLALVEAGVSRVVVGVGDPNPLVAAAGIATLEMAGIAVCLMDGKERQACFDMNKEFMERMVAEAAAAAAAATNTTSAAKTTTTAAGAAATHGE